MRFLGREYGYYPEEPHSAYLIDSALDGMDDLVTKFFRAGSTKEEEAKKAALGEFMGYFDGWLTIYEKRKEANGSSKYLVGEKMTILDVNMLSFVYAFILNEAN